MYHISLIFFIFLLITVPTHAARLALIIGNGDYQKVASLDNPVNDAKDMAAVLKNLGFAVTLKTNASHRTMKNAVRQFGRQLNNGDVALFYYSGHGMQFNHRNYLVPPEADIQTGADIEFEGLDANFVLAQMEQANKRGVNLMILDACRDNPYKTNVKNLRKGLAKMQSPMGSLIAYATAPDLASYGDSNTRNSIYTQYLLDALRQKAHLSILDMLTEVTAQVTKRTRGQQVPWQASSLTQRFCFAECRSWQRNIPQKPDFSRQLATCEIHLRANRLTTGRGGTALACYEAILKQDPTNTQALAGLTQIENKYVTWIKNALRRGQKNRAKGFLASLRTVNPESPKIVEFEEQMQPAPRSTPTPPRISSRITPLQNNSFAPGKVFRDRLKDGSLGPEMVWIPAGRFRMGDIQGSGSSDEKPVHLVNVKQFAMGKYEVTVGEFQRFVNATGYKTDAEKGGGCYMYDGNNWKAVKHVNWRNPNFSQNDNHPVVCVSWNDATAYVKWLSQQTGKPYRLPTEAEWEYATRAGTKTSRYWGNDPNHACRYANVHDKTSKKENGFRWTHHNCTDGYANTAPVGSFKSNAFGLFDMLGNAWEWMADLWHENYNSAPTDGSVWRKGGDSSLRVVRSGAWNTSPRYVRVSYRVGWWQVYRYSYNYVGFRLARTD
jgi:formylglycine-generating enzyme required for sulfatase activity